MPAVTEPLIVWTTSGEAETQERENNGPWLKSHVKKNSLFLTAAGAPYDFQYRTLSSEPYEVVLVLISLPLFNEALREVFGTNAANTRLRDLSGFEDPELTALIRPLRDEALRAHSSRLVVRGLGQAIAVHLARHYTAVIDGVRGAASSLPGFGSQPRTRSPSPLATGRRTPAFLPPTGASSSNGSLPESATPTSRSATSYSISTDWKAV